jgi:hypothetical protein
MEANRPSKILVGEIGLNLPVLIPEFMSFIIYLRIPYV